MSRINMTAKSGDWVTTGSEDEQRVITAINGDRITLDRPSPMTTPLPELISRHTLRTKVATW